MSEGATADRTKTGGAYRVLARKYRPTNFSELIGQEPMVRTLTNAFASGRIAQAWMLTGVRGVGKTTTARILARALNYRTAEIDQPTVDLAAEGEHCRAIMEGRHVDVIEMDAASHTGVDNMRELLEQVRYAPVSARYKVYIIDEVHMLSGGAFNAMLKTLEEPPPHVKFIFATTEIRKVPITILSRCQRFDLRRIDATVIATDLKRIAGLEGIEVEDEALAMVARAAEGSMRDAQSIFDQAIAHSAGKVTAETVRSMLGLADRARVVDLFEHLMSGNVAAALAEYRSQYDAGADPAVVLTDLAEFNHLVTRIRFVPEAANDASLTEEERRRGEEFAGRLSVRVLSRAWQMLLKGIAEVQSAHRPVAAGEMVLIRIAHAADLPTLDEALKSLEDGDRHVAEPPRATSVQAHASHDGGNGGATAVAGQRLATSGNGNGPAMRLVEQAAPAVTPEPSPQPTAEPQVAIASLEDIVALADANRDLAFKVQVKRCVRLVRIEPGMLEVNLTEDAPKTLLNDLTTRLKSWSGRNWFVSLSREPGGETLAEIEDNRRESAIVSAKADPTVAAVLASFPGARITDVRIFEADDDLGPADVADPDDEPDDDEL